MVDGEETVEIACGDFAGRDRDSMLDAQETVQIYLACESFAGRERYSMLDGEETVEIACGELRREGARQHAGRIGNRANSLGKASLGKAIQHAGQRGDRGNSLGRASLGGSETACWTDRKPWK